MVGLLFNIDSKKIDGILIVEKKLLQISFLTRVVKNIFWNFIDLNCWKQEKTLKQYMIQTKML